MEVHVICNEYMIFTSPADELINGKALNKLVHKIQKESSMTPWENICAEIYCCCKENLYFIYPDEPKIYLADYALPFLKEYFTD